MSERALAAKVAVVVGGGAFGWGLAHAAGAPGT
jgi:hypothetical protein